MKTADCKNPWGLTPHQERAIAEVTRVGVRKTAASNLNISNYTMDNHLDQVRKKMGKRFLMLAVLEYDRWKRSQA